TSITGLVLQLVSKNANAKPPEETIRVQVREFLGKSKKILEELAKEPDEIIEKQPMEEASVAKLFEEVKVMFQDLPSRVEDTIGGSGHRRKWRHFHPHMIEKFLHNRMGDDGDPIVLLMIASFFRDEIPWLYELGLDAYRTALKGDRSETNKAIERFRRAARDASHGPFTEMFS